MQFRWNEWNTEHIEEHGVAPEEAEWVVENARPPYPELQADEKWLVMGQSRAGRFLQVVFVEDDDGKSYVIHSRPLTEKEKRRYRRRTR